MEVHCEFSSDPIADLISLAENNYSTPILITELQIEKIYGTDDHQMEGLRRMCKFPFAVLLFPEMNLERSEIQVEPNEKVLRIFPSPIFSCYFQQIVNLNRVLLPYFSNRPEEFVAFEMTLLLADSNPNMEVDILCTIDLSHSAIEMIQQRMTAAQIRFQFTRTTRTDVREAVRDLLLRATYSLMVIGDGDAMGWIRDVPLENLPVLLAKLPPPREQIVSNV